MNEPQNFRPYGNSTTSPELDSSSALAGFFMVLAMHLFWLILPIAYLFLGITQLVYVLPLVIIALVKGKKRMAAGAGIAAAITLLAQGIFCGLVFSGQIKLF